MKPYGEMRVLEEVPESPEASSITTIQKKVGMTFSHTRKLLEILELDGWVRSRKIGRMKIYTRLKIGSSLAYAWSKFWRKYEGIE